MSDKSFFRTEVFASLEHLRPENDAFVAFHNDHHRYAARAGATPNEMRHGRLHQPLRALLDPATTNRNDVLSVKT